MTTLAVVLLLITATQAQFSIDPSLVARVLSDPDLLRKLDPKILRHVLINSAQRRPEHSAKQLLSPPLQRLPPPELPVFPARLPQGGPGSSYRNVFPAFGEGNNRQNPTFQQPPQVALHHLDPFQRHLAPGHQGPTHQGPAAFPAASLRPFSGALPGYFPSFQGRAFDGFGRRVLESGEAENSSQAEKLSPATEDFSQANPQPSSGKIVVGPEPDFISIELAAQSPEVREPKRQSEFLGEQIFWSEPNNVEEKSGSSPHREAKRQIGLLSLVEHQGEPSRQSNFLSSREDVARTLQENPSVAEVLARQILPFMIPQDQVLPPLPAAPSGVCSLVTHSGQPCDPGLAYSGLTRSCEWPDTLLEEGCNPEVVTGFGPCPQDAEEPRLTPAQIASWPQPKFPVNLDVVTVQNFDAFLAKKFFVVCVPTVYGRLFPRLICCPDHTFFDPFHIDGCVYEHHHHPDEPHDIHHHTLPPPTFGSPDPFIKHVGAPLPIGGFIKKRSVRAASNGTSLDWKERLNEAAILIE